MEAPPVAQGQGGPNRSSVQIDSEANRRATGFRWADKFDSHRAEEPVVVVVVAGKGADSYGPCEEILERESASCQPRRTDGPWAAGLTRGRALRADGNRRLRDERFRRWTRAKARDWAYRYNSIRWQTSRPSVAFWNGGLG